MIMPWILCVLLCLISITAMAGAAPKVVLVANFGEGIEAIKDRRAAGLISEAVNIDVFLARHAGAYQRSPLLTEDRYAVGVAKGNSDLLAAVNEVLAALEAPGQLKTAASDAELPIENERSSEMPAPQANGAALRSNSLRDTDMQRSLRGPNSAWQF